MRFTMLAQMLGFASYFTPIWFSFELRIHNFSRNRIFFNSLGKIPGSYGLTISMTFLNIRNMSKNI
jgi:hypothetical protein